MKPTRMKLSLLAAAAVLVTAAPALAAAKLSVTVVTGSPAGFLVDGMFTLADAHRVVAAVLDSKKNLTTVYVTHDHPDHYFGLTVIKQAFPKAKLVALPATIAGIKKTWQGKVKQWGPMYGANLTDKPLIPSPLGDKGLTLEGETLEVRGGVQGDAADNSYVYIPSINTVIAGDVVYNGVHPWTAETNAEGRAAWLRTLDEIAALRPTTVIAGHKDPKAKDDLSGIEQTRAYLKAFDEVVAAAKGADEVESKMKAKYPNLALDIIVHFGAQAQFPAPAAAAKK
jgi:glyoxylase-like metal-dependent hydrolase (beta-lactamase superfamily II)